MSGYLVLEKKKAKDILREASVSLFMRTFQIDRQKSLCRNIRENCSMFTNINSISENEKYVVTLCSHIYI